MRIIEHGVVFETGRPVTVRFVRGTSPSPKPGLHDLYQQRIEPAGRYLIHSQAPGPLGAGWERGEVRFESPLVVPLNTYGGSVYDEHSWKMNLSRQYGGKTGKSLSRAIVKSGHDAVVTVTLGRSGVPSETREIVDLTMWSAKVTARGLMPRQPSRKGAAHDEPRLAIASRPMFHGSRTGSDQLHGPSYFTSDPSSALSFGKVSAWRLSLKKPFIVKRPEDWLRMYANDVFGLPLEQITLSLTRRGYDSAMIDYETLEKEPLAGRQRRAYVVLLVNPKQARPWRAGKE